MKKLAHLFALSTLTLILVVAPPIHADAASTDAGKAHAERGMTYYNLSDWPAAIREFRAAFEADPRPEYLFSKGQAERHGGDCAAAILSFKAFLRTSGGSSTRVAAVEELITECEAKLEDARKKESAAAEAAAEERKEQSRRQGPISAPTKTAPAVMAAPESGSWVGDPAGLVLSIGGVSLAAGGAALVVWGNALMRHAPEQATYQQYESDVSSAKTRRVLGGIGMGTGAAMLLVGIVRYTTLASTSSQERPVALGLELNPTGAWLRGRF